jgi:hypothetical protein
VVNNDLPFLDLVQELLTDKAVMDAASLNSEEKLDESAD